MQRIKYQGNLPDLCRYLSSNGFMGKWVGLRYEKDGIVLMQWDENSREPSVFDNDMGNLIISFVQAKNQDKEVARLRLPLPLRQMNAILTLMTNLYGKELDAGQEGSWFVVERRK